MTTQPASPALQAPSALPNRWIIAVMGTLLQLCLGTVYAWSFWTKLFMKSYGWTKPEVTLVFSIAICFLGLAAAWGGMNLGKYGPRKLAMIGGILFGVGYLIASAALAITSLPLLILGYGVIGGIGLGLGYVTPVATVAKWFPDHKGLATGMVIMGFGLGAALMSVVLAPTLVFYTKNNFPLIFAALGVLFLVAAPLAGSFLKNPPAGFLPKGYSPAAGKGGQSLADLNHATGRCVTSGRFGMMWLVFFCNITAGIALISLQSPLMQDVMRKADSSLSLGTLEAAGAMLIAISSLFNGVGRFFWGSISDRIGRVLAFRLMLITQIAAFVALTQVGNPWLFGALVCYIFLCYGGGFGTMPSWILDVFGPRKMAVVYGIILTAWSAGGIVGPQLFARIAKALEGTTDAQTLTALYSFGTAAGILGLGLLCALFLSNKAFRCRQIEFNKCKTAEMCVALEKA